MYFISKYHIIAILLAFSTNAFSQIDIINTTFNVKDTNVLFVDINNDVIIKTSTPGIISLYSNKSKIEKKNGLNNFNVRYTKTGIDTLYAKRNGKVLFAKSFIVKSIDEIKFTIGYLKGLETSKAEIIANKKLMLDNTECNCAIPYRVLSYTIHITSNKLTEGEKHFSVEGGFLDEKAISSIQRMEKGDIVEFTDIKAIIYLGCPRDFRPFKFKIK